jgi:hypothetical protein
LEPGEACTLLALFFVAAGSSWAFIVPALWDRD